MFISRYRNKCDFFTDVLNSESSQINHRCLSYLIVTDSACGGAEGRLPGKGEGSCGGGRMDGEIFPRSI